MPEIEGETDFKPKALRFKKTIFTESSVSTGEDLIYYIYKNLYEIPKKNSRYKIRRAIYELSSGWTPKLDNILSKIPKATTDIIMSHVYLIFNACFKIGYYPYYFKKSVIEVLCKPNKDDYTKLKSYHLMMLLNTLGKVLEAILAKRLSYLVTKHTLLSHTHIGRRKDTSTNHKYYYILKQVYAAWNTKKVASLLLFDVAGALDNIHQS